MLFGVSTEGTIWFVDNIACGGKLFRHIRLILEAVSESQHYFDFNKHLDAFAALEAFWRAKAAK